MYRNIRQPFVPFTQRFTPVNRTLIKSKDVNESEIQRLFETAMVGNITELKKMIKMIGLTVSDMIDSEGKSIIHIIIENDNLTTSDKTDCLKYLNKHCGLTMSYNSESNFSTPLHLACKNQLYDVAELLIKAGHDINALDANGKTPIFYALTAMDASCPELKKSKKDKVKIDNLSVQNLSQNLQDLINKDTGIFNLLSFFKFVIKLN